MLLLEWLDTNKSCKPEEESVYNVIQAKYAEMTSLFAWICLFGLQVNLSSLA